MGDNMKSTVTIDHIKGIEAFKDLKETTLLALLKIANLKKLNKNEVLFRNKDQIGYVYAVIYGKMALLRYCANGQKRVFFILNEGSLINEVVFDNLPVSVDCECFEQALIITFPKLEMLALMKNDFDLTLQILNSSARKQRRLFRQLKNTVQTKIDKKLAAKLWKLTKDHGRNTTEDGWKEVDLNINITYLSYLLGVPRESISRAMSELIDKGYVKWREKALLVNENEILEYYRKV